MNVTIMQPVSGSDSAAQRVERELRRAIVSLEIQPGMRLSEAEIAARYGVSRQPAREALISLARAKLVETQPQRGTVVARISASRMREARFVREAIEAAVVRRAAEHFDPQSLERCQDLLEAQARASCRGRHEEFQRLDELFHRTIAEGSECTMAWEAIADIKAHMDRVCQLTLPLAAALDGIVDQHRAVISAIEKGDADGADAAMRFHLTDILRTLPQVEAEHPHLFEKSGA